jgi:ubiquinol-cytochrome c reductase iron-sulfur subunit
MRRGERAVGVCFIVTTLAALGLAATYLRGGQPQAEGALLAAALLGLGFGFLLYARWLLPEEETTQAREELASPDEDRAGFERALDRGSRPVGRRGFLVTSFGAAVGALGVAFLFPALSLGPAPGRTLFRTAWRKGARLVTPDGTPVKVGDLDVGGVLTVFPEGATEDSDAQTLLIRVTPDALRPRRGREGWAPDGYVAYSKICTHAGCPVGLFQTQTNELLCPCHQSTFDVTDGARPVFGPATRSLPQLPLSIDAEGYLVAQSDYTEAVGPAFWDRP